MSVLVPATCCNLHAGVMCLCPGPSTAFLDSHHPWPVCPELKSNTTLTDMYIVYGLACYLDRTSITTIIHFVLHSYRAKGFRDLFQTN